MKNVFLVLSLLLALAIPAASQTIHFLPDPNAPLIALFPVSVNIALDPSGHPFVSKTETGGQAIVFIGSFRTQSGKIEYQMISDSIRYKGQADIIDNTPTQMVYAFLAQEAMFQGVIRGWTPAPDCSTPWYANVYSEPCVSRVGTGEGTHFIPCDRVNYSTWKFSICRASGDQAPTIAGIGCSNPNTCDESCQPTCPNYDGSQIK